MPGLGYPLQADYMSYAAYVINREAISSSDRINASVNYNSMCGISNLVENELRPSDFTLSRIRVTAATQGAESITYKLMKLRVSTNYRVIVIATCDTLCLQQLSKQHDDPQLLLSCIPTQVGAGCKSQSLVYAYLDVTTGDTSDMSDIDNNEDSNGTRNYTQDFISLSIVIIAVVVIIIFATSMHWMKYNPGNLNCLSMFDLGRYRHPISALDDDDDDDDEDVFGDSSSSSRSKSRSIWSKAFQSHSHSQQPTDRKKASTEMIHLNRAAVYRAPQDSSSEVGYRPPVVSAKHSRFGDSSSSSSSSTHSQRLTTGVEQAKMLLDKWVIDPIKRSSAKTIDDAAAVDPNTKYTSLPLLDNEELELHL